MAERQPSASLPPFSSLILGSNGTPENAWCCFGATDPLDMLDFITPSTVARAVRNQSRGPNVSGLAIEQAILS